MLATSRRLGRSLAHALEDHAGQPRIPFRTLPVERAYRRYRMHVRALRGRSASTGPRLAQIQAQALEQLVRAAGAFEVRVPAAQSAGVDTAALVRPVLGAQVRGPAANDFPDSAAFVVHVDAYLRVADFQRPPQQLQTLGVAREKLVGRHLVHE